MAYEDRAPVAPIVFGGLNTHHNELFLTGADSPAMLNAHLYPVGSMSKRAGLQMMLHGADTRSDVPGTGACKALMFLSKLTEDSGHLYTIRSGTLYRNNLDDGANGWVNTGITVSASAPGYTPAPAYYLDETVAPEVRYADCLYVANKFEKPRILTGDVAVEEKVWPKGAYNVSVPSQVPGYPDRWEDPLGTGAVEDWPRHLGVYGRGFGMRLMAWGFELDPQRIDYSVAGVPYNFLLNDLSAAPSNPKAEIAPGLDGGFFYAERGDGDRVVSAQPFRDYLVVYKKFKTLLYSGNMAVNTQQEDPFRLQGVLPVGAVSHESIVTVGNDHYFWSPEGPRRLSAAFSSGLIQEDIVSREVQTLVRSISKNALEKVTGRHEPEFGRVLWHIPIEGASTNNSVVCFYYPTSLDPKGRWTVFDGRYCEMAATVMAHPLGSEYKRAFGANADGNVYEMNLNTVDDYNDSGGAVFDDPEIINLSYETRWIILAGLLHYAKNAFVDMVVSDEGYGSLTLEYALDYSNTWRDVGETLSAVADQDSGFWDYTTWDSFTWDESARALLHFNLGGLGRIIRFRIKEETESGCGLGGLILDARVKGGRG